MYQQHNYYRGEALGREKRTLPADTHHDLIRLHRQKDSKLLLPIPKLNYLAVIQRDEICFVDLHMRQVIEFAWQGLRAENPDHLFTPLHYEFCWYNSVAHEIMDDVPDAFATAISRRLARSRQTASTSGSVLLSFPTPAGE
ncbi:MAG TPA: hypothetical protein DD979_14445 [Gammaproteobacteria bacterium]|jgi:hypothetical protein|nr:hypothetical protein [Gammaproteobacteria bacterium]